MRRTKLVCTLGPASENKDVMRGLFQSGQNVARFNFSHGDHAEHGRRLKTVRELNKELGTYVGTMLDTKGPEIRTNEFEGGKVTVLKDSTVRIAFKEILGTEKKFSLTYPGLYDDVEIGTTILIDDGYLELVVTEKDAKNRELVTKAINTHSIKNRRGVNVPNVLLNMPFISEKDRADIEFGADNNYDFIATSFTRRASDVEEVRAILKAKGKEHIKIISKIENQEGVDNIIEITEASDGIMVARGDLGVEITPEDLPSVQKEMVSFCQATGKIVIVATQMLESMQSNPRPTRAEISDVANAVYEGTDCTMLSGESAAGIYPKESVAYMSRINIRTEIETDYQEFFDNALFFSELSDERMEILAGSVASAVLNFDISAVVIDCHEDALLLSKYRLPVPVVVIVDSLAHATTLSCNYGLFPVLSEKEAKNVLKEAGIETGNSIIYVNADSFKIAKF